MLTAVKMPRLGESVAEGTIGTWLKQEGDDIEKDEAIAEIITDKINAELPSPIAGRLSKILVQADQTVPVETDIALIEEYEDGTSTASASETPSMGMVPAQSQAQTTASVLTPSARTHNDKSITSRESDEQYRISPLARRLAREHGIDLHAIAGTGSNGRVRKEDILAYVEQQQENSTLVPTPALKTPPTSNGAAAAVTPLMTNAEQEIMQPSRMRLAIAEHMVRSKRTSPHATTVVEVDMTAIAKWLEHNKADFKRRTGNAISYVPFVMQAVCEGIRKFPIINSTWTAENKIIIKKHIHLGIAVSSEAGLLVPTVYDADQYSLAGLAQQVSTLASKARNNKLSIQDMQNSTFVVNNPGVFGTIISTPIINQPHAAILSMDAVVKRPVVIADDAIAVRAMMYLCLSFDHRLMDGAEAAGFLQAVRTKLQSYGRDITLY